MGQIIASIERAAHLIGAHLEGTTSALRVTQGEAHVMAQLARRGPTAITTLHHEFGHKRSTLTNIIDRLEQRGLVRREPNANDRRSFVVHLTAPGRRTARRITKVLDQLENDVTELVVKRDVTGLDAVAGALETMVRRQTRG
jgi:DNA-binding MarR family transcriptional regulator